MEDETLYFLPSEVARLILGYLLDEGYKLTYKTFLKECPNLKEYLSCIAQGHKYSLKINCMTLVEILEDYGSMKSAAITRRVANPSLASLWKQFDTVVDCIKKQVTSKQFLYEGSMVQSTRTRHQMRQYQRNKILQSCVTVMDKQSESLSGPLTGSSTIALSPVASTSVVKSPVPDHLAGDSSPKPQTLPEDLDENDDNEPMDTCPDDEVELPPPDNASAADKRDPNIVNEGKEGENSSCQNTEKVMTESDVNQTTSRNTEDEMEPVSPVITTTPLNSDECVPSTSQETQAPPLQHTCPNTALSDQQTYEEPGNLDPSGDTTRTHDSSVMRTPDKRLSQISTDSVTDKSPRRKRPPKRKSLSEKRKSQSERPGSSVQNESSNSTDGSLHDNMVPQMIMNQLLSNPHLTHKLAENINKSLHPDATPPPAPPPEIQTFEDICLTDRSLEDILDEHETRMTQSQIECIIDNTQSDPDLGSLFGIFNIGIPSTSTSVTQQNHTDTNSAAAEITTSTTENQKSTDSEMDTDRNLCTPVPFTQTHDRDEGVSDTYVPLDSYEAPSTFTSQELDEKSSGHFVPIKDNSSLKNTTAQNNWPLVSNTPLTCSVQSTSMAETRDSTVYSPLPCMSGSLTPDQNNLPLVSNTPLTCSAQSTSMAETRDSTVYTPTPGTSGAFAPVQCSVSASSSSRSVITEPSCDSINISEPDMTRRTKKTETRHSQHISVTPGVCSTSTSVTNCVTAQPFATMLTSHQPITSQPSSPPVTTAVTSLQPVTSAFSPEFGPMKMNVETSPHGFPVLSLTTTSQSNLDFSDNLLKTNSLAENMTSSEEQFSEKNKNLSKNSTSYKCFRTGVDLSRNSSTPIAGTETTGGVTITSEASSVMQALASSADSLTTINIHSLYDTMESKEQETQKPSKKGKKEPRRKKSPARKKSSSSNNSSGWSSELSALVKITSPEKKTSNKSKQKAASTKPKNKVTEKLKEQASYMAVLSPGGKTVQQIPVLEVDSLSEYGDAQDLIPVGTMVATTITNSDTELTPKSSSRNKTRSKSKALPKRSSPKSPALSAIQPTACAQVMMTSSPQKSMTPRKTQNLIESTTQEQPALLSMPTLQSLSSPSVFSTSLSLPVMLSSQPVNSNLSVASTPKLSSMATAPSPVVMSPITNIPQAVTSKESVKISMKTPEKILAYNADQDFLDSPQSMDCAEVNESTGEDMAHKLFENTDKRQDVVTEKNKSYLEKQARKEVHVRSLNFGVDDNSVPEVGDLPPKNAMQQRNIFGLEVVQSPEGIRQLAYGRGHKNPNKTNGPGVKKASSTSSGKRRPAKSTGVVKEKRGTSVKLSSNHDKQTNIDNQSNSSLDPVTHVATDIHSFIIQRNKKTAMSSVSEIRTSVANSSTTTTPSKVIMNKSNSVTSNPKGICLKKQTNVEIPRNTTTFEDFIPDSSGKVYLSPATSVVLTPEKSDLGPVDQVLFIGGSQSEMLPRESIECQTRTYSGVKSAGSVVHVLNDMQDGKKALSDSEHSCGDGVEVCHSEGSVTSSQNHQESDRDIFADTDDDCVMPRPEPPVVVSEISHDIAVIPSVFSANDKVKSVRGKFVVQNRNDAESSLLGGGLSNVKQSLIHSQEKTLVDNTHVRNSRYEVISDVSLGRASFHDKSVDVVSTNKNAQTMADQYHLNRRSVVSNPQRVNSNSGSDRFVGSGDNSSSIEFQSALHSHDFVRDDSVSSTEEEDVDIMSEWDNPWQAGLTSGDTTVVENSSHVMTPVQQEHTIQHDSTGIQRTRKHNFLSENLEIHKEILNRRKLKYTSMENRQTFSPLQSSETISQCSPQGQENFTQEDRLLCGDREYRQDSVQNTGIQPDRLVNQSDDRSSCELERSDQIMSLNCGEVHHASQHDSAQHLQRGDNLHRTSTNQRSPGAASLQKVKGQKQQCQANSSHSKLISFKRYQQTSNKVLSIPEDEDSYDLPDLSTPSKLCDSRDTDPGGSGCSDRSTASHTSYQSAVTPSLYQHVTPPKKRITASLKNGDSLYFFSTQSSKTDSSKVEPASGKLKSAVKTLGHVNQNSPRSSIVVNSPRRQRKTTLTPRKELDASPVCGTESSVSKSPIREEATPTPTKRARQKRQLEGNNATDSKIPQKKKKSSKVVDLGKVDVEKFLTKLHSQ